jgi:hypothetical protein
MAVAKLDDSIRFYSSLFDAVPSVVKPDYAVSWKDHRLSQYEEKTEWIHSPMMIFAMQSVPGMA